MLVVLVFFPTTNPPKNHSFFPWKLPAWFMSASMSPNKGVDKYRLALTKRWKKCGGEVLALTNGVFFGELFNFYEKYVKMYIEVCVYIYDIYRGM